MKIFCKVQLKYLEIEENTKSKKMIPTYLFFINSYIIFNKIIK